MTLQRRIKSMQTYLEQREAMFHFSQVPDPRARRGRRWSLKALLGSALTSLVLLAPSLRRAEQLSEDLAGSRLMRRLGVRRRVPDSTMGEMLARAAPQGLLDQLHWQVRGEHRRKALKPEPLPVGVIAIDGKVPAVLKEAANPYFCQQQNAENEPGRYLYRVLNATLISSKAAVCIHQEPIPAWTNEMGHFEAFFDNLCAAYSRADLFEVVTTDAGVLSQAHCRKLNELGFGYVLALKDNNPGLELEARGLLQSLAEHEPCVAEDDEWELDSSRGWVKRQLWTSTELAGWPGWEHLRQVWLVRVWCRKGKNAPVQHLEDRIYVTNLPVAHAIKGKLILTLIRSHWRIENELHGTLDIQLREDDPWWVRRGCGLITRAARSPDWLDAVTGERRSPVWLDGVNTGLLRVMAYNLLAIARAVHLRRDELISWKQLRDWMRDALVFWGLVPDEVAPENMAPD